MRNLTSVAQQVALEAIAAAEKWWMQFDLFQRRMAKLRHIAYARRYCSIRMNDQGHKGLARVFEEGADEADLAFEDELANMSLAAKQAFRNEDRAKTAEDDLYDNANPDGFDGAEEDGDY